MSNVVQINYFAAIPGRAVIDDDLTGLQIRILAAVAGHDRMGRNGQCCWAGRKAMAERVRCTETSFSEAMTKLIKAGYIEVVQSETDGRRKGYRVIYEQTADAAGIGSRHKNRSATDNLSDEDKSADANLSRANRSAKADVSKADRSATDDDQVVSYARKNQANQLINGSLPKPQYIPRRGENIPSERENTPAQNDEGKPPPNPKMDIVRHWYSRDEQHDLWELLKHLRPFEWNRLIGLWKKGELTLEHKQWAEDTALKASGSTTTRTKSYG